MQDFEEQIAQVRANALRKIAVMCSRNTLLESKHVMQVIREAGDATASIIERLDLEAYEVQTAMLRGYASATHECLKDLKSAYARAEAFLFLATRGGNVPRTNTGVLFTIDNVTRAFERMQAREAA